MEQSENRSKTALITGAACGLGPAYAEYFSKIGYSLILTGRDKKEIRSLSDRIEKSSGVNVTALSADLSDRKGLSALYRQIDFVSIDALVHNAPVEDEDALGWANTAEAKRLMALEMNSSVSLTLSVLRRMINRNEGIIINVIPEGSVRFATGSRLASSYKMFIRQFTEGLSTQLTDTEIRVQAICPGPGGTIVGLIGGRQTRKNRLRGIFGGSEPCEIVESAMRDLEQKKFLHTYSIKRISFTKGNEYFAG